MTEAAAFKAHYMRSQIRPCRYLELHFQAGGSLQLMKGKWPPNAGTVGPDEILCVLSLLLCHTLLQHERTAHAGSACGQFICKSRALMQHQTHVDLFVTPPPLRGEEALMALLGRLGLLAIGKTPS